MRLDFSSIALTVAVFVCTAPIHAQGKTQLSVADSVSVAEFVRILNEGAIQHLDSIAPARQFVGLHLYRVSERGPRIPETHVICSYRYYLAVSDFGEYPDQSVFGLGEVGEIRSAEWLPTTQWGTALLRVVVSNYPAYAYGQNPDVEEVRTTYELDVRVAGMTVREVQGGS